MRLWVQNPVLEKSYQFALRVVRLHKYLADIQREYVISKKLWDAGTEIGAQVKAAREVGFKDDFIRRMQIAFVEAGRTEYWLQLLMDSDFIDENEYSSINSDCVELKNYWLQSLNPRKLAAYNFSFFIVS